MNNITEVKMKLTESQIKILEDTFSSYPAGYTSSTNFTSMEGIQRQIDDIGDENEFIFYMSLYDGDPFNFIIEKMIPGVDVQQNNMTEYIPEEPTESQIENRMTAPGESYYNTRENHGGIKMDQQGIRYNLIELLLRDERYHPTMDVDEIISLAEKYTRYIVDVNDEDEIIHIECPQYYR